MKKLHTFLSTRLFILAIIALIVLLLSQLFGRYVWQLELFSHFVPYYAIALLLAGLIFPPINHDKNAKQQKLLRGVFLFAGMALILWCLPSYQMLARWYQIPEDISSKTSGKIEKAEHASEKKATSIAYQNVNISNKNKINTLTQLTKNTPENLILLEAGGDWSEVLKPLKATYPVHCADEQFSPFAMQVFSKNKMANCELMRIADLPMIRLELHNERVIYVIHPPPPINQELAKIRLAYLTQVKKLLIQDSLSKPVMVIGDMNATAFSPVYRDFINGTKLQKTTANGTPTWLPFAIGIDHVLTNQTNDDFAIKTLGWHGSDHRGFEVAW